MFVISVTIIFIPRLLARTKFILCFCKWFGPYNFESINISGFNYTILVHRQMGRSSSKPVAPVVKDITPINPAEFIEYKSAFENGEMSKLKKKIDEDQNRWRKIVVNIAVIGNSGVGKSSFINSFRGIRANCDGAAEVGVNETTEVPTKYVHPGNMNIALWDLPGVGSLKFPKSTNLQDVGFDKYDYFLIISSTRFTENDLWLAKEVHKLFFHPDKNECRCRK
jgi:hypothetical protein